MLEFGLETPDDSAYPVKNPFDSLLGTVICGIALTAVLYSLVRSLVAA